MRERLGRQTRRPARPRGVPTANRSNHQVTLYGLRRKFALEPYRSLLLLTHPHPLAENSPTDHEWGCRDPHGGYNGENLLGRALMHVRDELVTARIASNNFAGVTMIDSSHGWEAACQPTGRLSAAINHVRDRALAVKDALSVSASSHADVPRAGHHSAVGS